MKYEIYSEEMVIRMHEDGITVLMNKREIEETAKKVNTVVTAMVQCEPIVNNWISARVKAE